MPPVRVLVANDHAVVRAGLINALANLPELEVVGELGDGRALTEALTRLRPDREFRRLGLAAGAVAFLDKKDLDAAAIRQVIADAQS